MKYLFFALLFFFASAANANDFQTEKAALESEKASLDSDIKKLNIQITQTDSMAALEKQYGQQQLVKQKADLERRQAEIEDLKGKLSELSVEMQRERNAVSFSQTQIDNVEATRKALASQLASHCRRLEVSIKSSLPWDSESRVERVATLCRDLENGNSGAEEGFSRLKAIYAEEIRFGDEVQVSNRPITRNDGEIVNASILRIGNQWIVYQDDAGHLFGVLNRKIGPDGVYEYAWKEDLSFDERQAIKNAIDVKLSRKPPQMVKLPLSLSVLGN